MRGEPWRQPCARRERPRTVPPSKRPGRPRGAPVSTCQSCSLVLAYNPPRRALKAWVRTVSGDRAPHPPQCTVQAGRPSAGRTPETPATGGRPSEGHGQGEPLPPPADQQQQEFVLLAGRGLPPW